MTDEFPKMLHEPLYTVYVIVLFARGTLMLACDSHINLSQGNNRFVA